MRSHRDFEEKGKTVVIATICSITAIVAVVVIVLFANQNSLRRPVSSKSSPATVSFDDHSDIVSVISESEPKYTVSDLDFYNMYKDRESSVSESASATEQGEVPEHIEEETDETNDGKHILITKDDGTEEWVAINQQLPRHEYDFTNLLDQSGKLKYFENDRLVSRLGVDISKDEGYVDFVKLKKAGINFVMLRAGSRGYQTGQLNLDDSFTDNLKRANDAGLDVGVYFLSQAVTEDEAREEANLVITSLGPYSVTYPITFMMQSVKGEKSRADGLSKKDRTKIAIAFMKTVRDKGLKTMLCDDKSRLITKYDLTKLISDYDTWLLDPGADFPDYPYTFSMWRYTNKGSIDGIAGMVSMDICFTDYSIK